MTPWEQLVALATCATWRMPWPPSCLIMQSAASKRRSRQGRDYDNGCVTLTSVNRQSPSRGGRSERVGDGVCTSRVC